MEIKQYTRKETAKRLGVSERTLRRKYKNISSFDENWVNYMAKVYDLKRKLRVEIKAGKNVQKSLRSLIFEGIKLNG